jgi:large subunit ribosomal protein L18e
MKTTNEKSSVKEWIDTLSGASKGEHYPKLWKRVQRLVDVPSRRRPKVNLSKIENNTKEGDNVIVPGKVLSDGEITHKVTIAAIEFSQPTLKTLEKSGCKVVKLKDMINAEKVHVII